MNFNVLNTFPAHFFLCLADNISSGTLKIVAQRLRDKMSAATLIFWETDKTVILNKGVRCH